MEKPVEYQCELPADGQGTSLGHEGGGGGVEPSLSMLFDGQGTNLGHFFCVPQLYLWGSPLLGEIFAYVTGFFFFFFF